jgi:tetratricopeptide (TPR) repeat protein
VPTLSRQEKEDSDGDFYVDEKGKQVHLSEAGMERAEELLREAVELFRAAHPAPHLLRADFENNLAIVLHRRGATEQALLVLGVALDDYRATRGEEHPDTAGALRGLGVLFGALGRWEEAAEVYEDHARRLAEATAPDPELIAAARLEGARLRELSLVTR